MRRRYDISNKQKGDSMKAIKEPNVSVELIGGPKAGIIMTKAMMRDLFNLAKNNKIRRVLVVLEK